MGELAHIRNILEEIRRLEHVIGVSLISRGGLFILGDTPKGVHQETFAAMAAIMLGAAETSSAELKDNLSHVQINLVEKDVVLVGAGTRYLLAIVMDGKGDNDKAAKAASNVVNRVEITI
ncbi:MAG: roadblock/LC7 domain-containing protein [Methanomassiliicoccales archaeon]|jgi:predicted regulator of Ras-like GTPase activity (Roadblock/LC7/MglB family)|nr:roadblock/LC7 domain-containing protein [Methanomassiliicoccales archaeon]